MRSPRPQDRPWWLRAPALLAAGVALALAAPRPTMAQEKKAATATIRAHLKHIEVPALLLNARNDPFLPEFALPSPAEVSARVMLDQPNHGGHVGFMTGPFPGRIDWLSLRVFGYLENFVS